MAISKDQIAKYVDSDASLCIYCQSDRLEGSRIIEMYKGDVQQTIQCGDCGAAWADIYRLIGVQEMDDRGRPAGYIHRGRTCHLASG